MPGPPIYGTWEGRVSLRPWFCKNITQYKKPMKKIVHVSDLHLGARPYNGGDRMPEQRCFLDWLCQLLEKEKPDALVIAGDLFDVYYPPVGVQEVWFDFLARVRSECFAGCVVAIAGNHDSPSALGCTGRVLNLLGIHLVVGDATPQEEAFRVPCADGGALVFAAVPFLREGLLRTQGEGDVCTGFSKHAAEAVAAARVLDPDAPLVAVAHAVVTGAQILSDTDSERGRHIIGGVETLPSDAFADADYVALGHLHTPQTIAGRETARYSGSPIPMSFAEATSGAGKTLVIAEFDGGRGADVRVRTVGIPVFRELRAFAGSRETILKDIASWVPAVQKAGRPWASISVTEGEGSFAETCEATRAAIAEKGAELVVHSDDRRTPARRTDSRPLTVQAVRALNPVALARDRLSEPDLHLSETEIDTYMKLLQEVLP